MSKTNRTHTPAFKAQVAVAALKGDRTTSQIAAHFQIYVNLVHAWKKLRFDGAAAVFAPTGKGATTARRRQAGRTRRTDARGYETVPELESGLRACFQFDNERRLHQSLGYRPPAEVFGLKTEEPKRGKKHGP